MTIRDTNLNGSLLASAGLAGKEADPFLRQDLERLLQDREGPCVSVYMQTHRFGAEVQQNSPRLVNLLRSVEARLTNLGVPAPLQGDLLAPVRELAADGDYWRFQADGLALFAAPGLFQAYRLPVSFREQASVAQRFAVKPLVPLLEGDGRFYVLALSLKEVRLLEASRWQVRRLELGPIPADIDQALGYDQYYTGLGLHSASPQGLAGRPAVFHGRGDSDEDRFERDVRHYFERVARGLAERLADDQAPLILATVKEHAPIYRDASRDPRLLDRWLEGNFELETDGDLARRSWELIAERLEERRRGVLGQMAEGWGTGRVVHELPEVVRAADWGRIDTLLVDPDAERWGTYEPDLGRVRLHPEQETGDEELTELAVVRTLGNGGTVLPLAPEELPSGVVAAGLLRY